LKSVVLCSSIVAVMSPREEGHIYTESDWNESSEAAVSSLGAGASSVDIYAASKTAAEKAFWAFRDERHPSFTMTAINPALVGGPALLFPDNPEDINETIIMIYKVLKGGPMPPTTGSGTVVDVRDVARIFVFAVQHPEVANNERYLAISSAGNAQAVADILREAYPERRDVIDKGTPGAGYRPDYDISWKVSGKKAEEATGQKYIGFKESVLAAAKAFERYL
jgi:nucleoside-diphosphate-sugar epimerase